MSAATEEQVSYWELIRNGILKENTIFRLALSLCPAIAVTNNLKNGFFMGVAVVVVQVMVNLTISAMRNFIHPRIRLPIFMLVISGWVTIVNLVMDAAVPDVYKDVGLYIQLIVAFASILARAEMFASKNTVVPSVFDGIGMGTGFFIALMIISFFREVVGKGQVWGIPIIDAKPLLILILPAGGFFAVGILMAAFNWMYAKYFSSGGQSH
ncbi:MAG TPA: electron transport complex subunit RsxE [Dissulfurispiraceae bacterium]|nr:electron transport complex subunit RsxE [Dissulfurispiraceae bacterium]